MLGLERSSSSSNAFSRIVLPRRLNKRNNSERWRKRIKPISKKKSTRSRKNNTREMRNRKRRIKNFIKWRIRIMNNNMRIKNSRPRLALWTLSLRVLSWLLLVHLPTVLKTNLSRRSPPMISRRSLSRLSYNKSTRSKKIKKRKKMRIRSSSMFNRKKN